jgi:hypothetical protein
LHFRLRTIVPDLLLPFLERVKCGASSNGSVQLDSKDARWSSALAKPVVTGGLWPKREKVWFSTLEGADGK